MNEIIQIDYQRIHKPAFVCEFHPFIRQEPWLHYERRRIVVIGIYNETVV